MPTAKIVRTNQYTNRFRSIDIYMDNLKLGSIKNGETKIFEAPVGEHAFFAQGDWISSEKVTLLFNDNDEKILELGSPLKMNYGRLLLAAVFVIWLIAKTFFKKQINADAYILPLIGVAILVSVAMYFISGSKPPIYYMTFGRKEYLYLREPKID